MSRTYTHIEEWDLGHTHDGYREGYYSSLLAEGDDSIAVKAKHGRTKGEKGKAAMICFLSCPFFFLFYRINDEQFPF